MNEVPALPSHRRLSRWLPVVAVVVLAAVALSAWFGYRHWQARLMVADQARSTHLNRLDALEQSVEALRRDQRANARSIQDAAATNRVLRDEVLGLGQRNALLEENLARFLADSAQNGVQAARREEAELLLRQAQQRMLHAGDLEAARHLYGLAAGVLEQLDSPDYLNLRQALLQERTALDALGPGIRAQAAQQLAQWVQALDSLPDQPPPATDTSAAWWQQLLSPLVEIRPADASVLIARSERMDASDALQIEISLARAALERGDSLAWTQALQRADKWLQRLWPDSPQRQSLRGQLQQLQAIDLRPPLPELGSTLQQLRTLRAAKESP